MSDTRKLFLKPFLIMADSTDEKMDGCGPVVFKDKLWLYGGWTGTAQSPDRNTQYVYDGTIRTKLANAQWNPSHGFGIAVNEVERSIYKIGSDAVTETTEMDRASLYKSYDGIKWEWVTNNLYFMKDRVQFFFLIFGGTMIIGGGHKLINGKILAGNVYTDIWTSPDGGYTWTKIADGITHLGGNVYGQVAYFEGKFHAVCCPSKYDEAGNLRTYSRQHKSSTDLISWKDEAMFSGAGRQYGNLVVGDNKLWMVNGSIPGGDGGTNDNRIYYFNGADWTSIQAKSLFATHATGVAWFQGALHVWCGNLNRALWRVDLVDFDEFVKPV